MSLKDSILNKIPASLRTPAMFVLFVFLGITIWFFGVKAWNGIGNWMYHHSETDAKAEIQTIKTQLSTETKIANEAVGAFEASKSVIAEEKKKREIAESILADKSKTTDQKLDAYETAVKAVPTHTSPESTDQLCERAKSLGLPGC